MKELATGHWQSEQFSERMTTKEWREVLLNHGDSVIFHGHLRKLKARSLGAGVYEIGKAPRAKDQGEA